MTASAHNKDRAIASRSENPTVTPGTDTSAGPVLELNQDVLASSQRRRYLDSLENSELAT
jgi:hypothetical protein